MEREHIDFVTPEDKHKIVVKAWLTARERRSIRGVLLDGIKFSMKDDEETVKDKDGKEVKKSPIADYNLEGSSLDKMQDVTLKTVIISVNGETKDVLDAVLDMKEGDFNFIVKEIDKITGSLDEDSKKK